MRMKGVVYKACVRSVLTYEADLGNDRRDEEVEIKKVFELKIEGWRKRGRPVKRWIDVVEDMKRGE